MANKKTKNKSSKPKEKPITGWRGRLLTLTLVPLAVGIVLLIIWALDLETFGDPERLPPVAFFFVLLSFTTSNALQKRWFLSVGWALLCIASLVLWVSTETSMLIVSFILGLAGILSLGWEFFRRIRQQQRTL